MLMNFTKWKLIVKCYLSALLQFCSYKIFKVCGEALKPSGTTRDILFFFIGYIALHSLPLFHWQPASSDAPCRAHGQCSWGISEGVSSLRHSRGAPHALFTPGAWSRHCSSCCSLLPPWISAPPLFLTLQVYKHAVTQWLAGICCQLKLMKWWF